MRVLITGASGFIGKSLSSRLSREGHEVVAPTRADWDAMKGLPAPSSLFRGVDAIVSLAGAPIAAGRWSSVRKTAIRESRVAGTRLLLDGLERAASEGVAAPGVLVSGSAVGIYGDRGDTELDEGSGPGEGFLAQVCRDWEREALERPLAAPALRGLRRCALRTGIVLGRGGGALAEMAPLFRAGLGGPLGSGRQYMSWIHLDDLVGLIVACLTEPKLIGPVNGTAPEPVPQREFARALGRALHRPAFLPAPGFALKLALGELAGELLAGQRAYPRKALQAGFRFAYPTLDAALGAIFAT